MTWAASGGELVLRFGTFMGETYYFDLIDTHRESSQPNE